VFRTENGVVTVLEDALAGLPGAASVDTQISLRKCSRALSDGKYPAGAETEEIDGKG
jgi:hypothetical protein